MPALAYPTDGELMVTGRHRTQVQRQAEPRDEVADVGVTGGRGDHGAPLDNSLCERALKQAILHRKNALFYKTPHGAHVGDLFMSLIHTCELERANPFAYLTALQRHAAAMAANPAPWLPWNYQEALATPVPASG